MSLDWCENCQCLEGPVTEGDDGERICAHCGEEIMDIPEHDDWDMER